MKIISTIMGDFNKKRYLELKAKYEKNKNRAGFEFEGDIYQVGFAAYILEFLEQYFPQRGRRHDLH